MPGALGLSSDDFGLPKPLSYASSPATQLAEALGVRLLPHIAVPVFRFVKGTFTLFHKPVVSAGDFPTRGRCVTITPGCFGIPGLEQQGCSASRNPLGRPGTHRRDCGPYLFRPIRHWRANSVQWLTLDLLPEPSISAPQRGKPSGLVVAGECELLTSTYPLAVQRAGGCVNRVRFAAS